MRLKTRWFAGVAIAALLVIPLGVLAQDVQFDPKDLVDLLPFTAKTKLLIVTCLPVAYLLLGIARRFTLPTSTAGQLVRFIFDGWKHKSELQPQGAAAATGASPPASAGFSRFWLVFALAVGSLLVVTVARAQDAQPAPTAPDTTQPGYQAPETPVITIPQLPKVSLNLGNGWSLQGGVGLGGSGVTHGAAGWQIVKNVQLAGLLEIGTPWKWADPVLGPAWQTGASQGWGGTFGAVEKQTGTNLTLTASPIVVGGKVSWSYVAGTIIRY